MLGVCAALVSGAVLGNAFGQIVDRVIPGVTGGPGAFALVGMAAVFAGAARAPSTAILIVFEMTDDYRLIVPLLAGVIVSVLVAERVHRESIYTLKAVFVDLTLVGGSAALGKTIAELNLPHEVVLVAIRRGRELVLPHGNARLQARDMITALCRSDFVGQFKSLFEGTSDQIISSGEAEATSSKQRR